MSRRYEKRAGVATTAVNVDGERFTRAAECGG